MVWGIGVLVDADWNITPAGKVWQQLTGVQHWKIAKRPMWTNDVSLTTDARGRLDFTGFYGDYEVVSGQLRGKFTLIKGTSGYTVDLRSIEPTIEVLAVE